MKDATELSNEHFCHYQSSTFYSEQFLCDFTSIIHLSGRYKRFLNVIIMADNEKRREAILFNYETTNRTDYVPYDIKAPVFTTYKEKPSCLKPREPPLKFIHTLRDWKTAGVPFNLLHKPRPIIDTNPRKEQMPFFEPPDLEKEHSIKTRPRLVMTPAVSMDDIDDQNARDILINDMYTSCTARGLQEGIRPYFRVEAPKPGLPASANPIKLPRLVPPYVPPEWRMDSVMWDQKQLRCYCSTTRNFWLRQKLPPCNACDKTNAIHTKRRQICLAKP